MSPCYNSAGKFATISFHIRKFSRIFHRTVFHYKDFSLFWSFIQSTCRNPGTVFFCYNLSWYMVKNPLKLLVQSLLFLLFKVSVSHCFLESHNVRTPWERQITTRPMANWAPKVVAAVKSGDILEGVLIEHPPNDAKEEMRR